MAKDTVDAFLVGVEPRDTEEEGDASRFFIEGTFFPHAVIASHFAMIAGKCENGVFHLAGFFEGFDDFAHGVINDFDIAKVLCALFAPSGFGAEVFYDDVSVDGGDRKMIGADSVEERVTFWVFDKCGTHMEVVRVIEIVVGAREWGMGFKGAEDEQPRLVGVFADEAVGVVGDKGGHLAFGREGCALGWGKMVFAIGHGGLGFKTLFDEPLVIAAEWGIGFGITGFATVFDADPFIKAVLAKGVVAQVPFAKVGFAIGVGQHFGNGFGFVAQFNVVDHASMAVGIQACHE